jgi:hypothetical protein
MNTPISRQALTLSRLIYRAAVTDDSGFRGERIGETLGFHVRGEEILRTVGEEVEPG